MASEIKLRIKVDDDGSLNIVAKEAKKAAKSTDTLTKSTERATNARNRYSKGEKGVASAGANSTKNFSKMNQAMVGSGGLVGAYATLAANVFALTAAFGILQRGAAAEQLAEGLAFTGTVAGRNLPYVAERLREITGTAVSTAEAMSTVALATSSGFSSDQIMRLGKVAKGASLALGRDMTDALNRLIRGSAKLEPELLDELGIMVRLDDAAQTYATQLGTTVENLTQYQKRQAFVNAVISEGESSFSGIANSVEPNVYNQLAASLQDLLKDFTSLLNKALIPVVKMFSKSPGALIGGLLLFASTIRGALLPGLTGGAARMKEFAIASKKSADQAIAQVNTTGKLPQVYQELSKKIKFGTATTKDYVAAQSSLNSSMKKHNADLVHNSTLQDTSTVKYANKIVVMEGVATAQTHLAISMTAEAAAAKASAVSDVYAAAARGNLVLATISLSAVYKTYIADAIAVAIANGTQTASFLALRAAMFTAATGVKALGVMILTWLPWIGLLGIALGAAYAAWQEFFGASETTKKIKEIQDSFDHLNDSAVQLEKTLFDISLRNPPDRAWQEFEARIKTTAGVAADVRDRIREVIAVQQQAKEEALRTAYQALDDLGPAANVQKNQVKGAYTTSAQVTSAEDIAAAQKTLEELRKAFMDIETSQVLRTLNIAKDKIEFSGIGGNALDLVNKQIAAIKDLQKEGKLSAKALKEIIDMPSVDETTLQLIESMLSGIQGFSEAHAKFSAKVETPFDKMSDSLDETHKSLTQTNKDTGKLTQSALDLNKSIAKGDSPLSKAFLRYQKKNNGVLEKAHETVARMNRELKANMAIMQKAPGLILEQTAKLRKLKDVRKEDTFMLEEAFRIEDNITRIKTEALDAAENNIHLLVAETDRNAELLRIDTERAAIAEESSNRQERDLQRAKTLINISKREVNLKKLELAILKDSIKWKEADMRRELIARNFEDPLNRNAVLTAKQTRTINKAMLEDKLQALEDEYRIKKLMVYMEFDLLKAQAKKRMMDMAAAGAHANLIVDQYLLLAEIDDLMKRTIRRATDSHTSGKAALRSTTQDDAAVRDAAYAAFSQGETVAERFYEGFHGIDAKFDELTVIEKFGAVHEGMQPLIEDLESLGPNGAVVSSMVTGMFVMAESWMHFVDVLNKSDLKMEFAGMEMTGKSMMDILTDPEGLKVMASFMMALANTIGQTAQIARMASANKVAGIDNEIEAEKKRDGKSKESVAKIKALEKKKEQEKKKAFELNKKLQMAQIIVSTAAAVMMVAPFWPLMALIAVMGAAQLAMVAGTSYQGGGGIASTPGPSAISVGERSKQSDLSKSRSARGELAYFRGDQGIGGAESFRGAFYGKRHRAAGGNTGYVVGEQGPELFMPDRPGTIVPADDTAVMAGGANVTFNISAIDATGVEDVLAEQQGNIIQMLRTAANSYGEEFFEDIDETIYSTPRAASGAQRWGA